MTSRTARLRRPTPLLHAIALLLVAACGDDGGPSGSLRVVHLAAEVGALDARFSDPTSGREVAAFPGLGFGDASPFRAIPVGTWQVDLVDAGTEGPPRFTIAGLPVAAGGTVSLVVSEAALDDSGSDPNAFLVADEPVLPPPGGAALRLVHAGVGLPDVRVFLDGALLRAGLPYRADVLAADVSPTAFSVGLDFRDEPSADVSGTVQALGANTAATGFLVRRPTSVAGVPAIELVLFEPTRALGVVPLE